MSVIQGGSISASTFGSGHGGDIAIHVEDSLVIQEQSEVAVRTFGTGTGGNLTVHATRLDLFNHSLISAEVFGSGQGGDVEVHAQEITIASPIDDEAFLTIGPVVRPDGSEEFLELAVGAGLTTSTFGSGAAGTMHVATNTLDIHDTGLIAATTFSTGKGGDINVRADSITITRGESIFSTGIVTSSLTFDSMSSIGGNSGDIFIDVGHLDMSQGGLIAAGTITDEASGGVTIMAESITMSSNDLGKSTFIGAQTVGGGSAGTLRVQVQDELKIFGGAFISALSAGGQGRGGDVFISATDILLDGQGSFASINAIATGSGNAGNVDVVADNTLILTNNASLSTDTFAMAEGGDISIEADSVSVVHGSSISASTFGSGRGGDIAIRVDDNLVVQDQSRVTVSTFGSGTGGNLTVHAARLDIFNQSAIFAEVFSSGQGGDVEVRTQEITIASPIDDEPFLMIGPVLRPDGSEEFLQLAIGAGITTSTFGSGAAGEIRITTSTLDIHDTGLITATSFSVGKGGDLTIDADSITISRGDSAFSTGIVASSLSFDPTSPFGGGSGDIFIDVGHLDMSQGGLIATGTITNGPSGSVTIVADSITMSGDNTGRSTFIGAQTVGGGNAGTLRVQVQDELKIFGGAFISALSTVGQGSGGDVFISATDIVLDGQGIFANINATATGSGNAGNLNIVARNTLTLTNNASLSTFADTVDAGDIDVDAGSSIKLSGSSTINAQAALDGGNINITTPSVISLVDSVVSAEAGNTGGNIVINTAAVALNDSDLIANAAVRNGGNITIFTQVFVASADSVISATGGPFGVSGNINILSPDTDLSGSLVALSESLADSYVQLSESCAAKFEGEYSSFIVVGRGGVPVEPSRWLPSYYTSSPVQRD